MGILIRCSTILASVAVVAGTGMGEVRAQAGLLGNETRSFVAPGRAFAVSVPTHWQIRQGQLPDEFQFQPSGPGHPVLYVRRMAVPRGADPMQVALRAIDERLSKMPHFRLQQRRRVTLAGHRAATVTGAYAFQGNLQYPRAVEDVFVVVGTEAFVFHFDVLESVAASYVGQLNTFYQSFIPRPAGAGQVFEPGNSAQTPLSNEPDKLPSIEKVPF